MGFARGIGFSVAIGLIAFVLIFLPISLILMPPKIMDLMRTMDSSMMNPENNNATYFLILLRIRQVLVKEHDSLKCPI